MNNSLARFLLIQWVRIIKLSLYNNKSRYTDNLGIKVPVSPMTINDLLEYIGMNGVVLSLGGFMFFSPENHVHNSYLPFLLR